VLTVYCRLTNREIRRWQEELIMWYFAWILGILLACSFGLINAMWLEFYEDMDREAD